MRINISTEEFAERIREITKKRGMKQTHMARELSKRLGRNIESKYVNRWYTGKAMPRKDTIEQIANILCVPSNYLTDGNVVLPKSEDDVHAIYHSTSSAIDSDSGFKHDADFFAKSDLAHKWLRLLNYTDEYYCGRYTYFIDKDDDIKVRLPGDFIERLTECIDETIFDTIAQLTISDEEVELDRKRGLENFIEELNMLELVAPLDE